MCEVTTRNFNGILPELQKVLENSRFVSVDTEFSCLTASQKLQTSLFDSGTERYAKLKATVDQMIPTQIGLTAFHFDPNNNAYIAHSYTFYVFPRSFSFIDKKFLCQASSFQFLSAHGFDFNKLFHEGISYLDRNQENELIQSITSSTSCMSSELEQLLEEDGETINKWYHSAKDDDFLILKNVEAYKHILDIKYFFHKALREKYANMWTFEDVEGFKLQKVTTVRYEQLSKSSNLEDIFISDLLGFSKVFRILTSLQKPIIGHNLLLDLMVLVHNFEKPLPKSYKGFKKLVNSLFPTVYDTKCLSFDISTSIIPESKRWCHNTLPKLYEYFKDGNGRHLALNSPLIKSASATQQSFHYAGWDSYCTGYIFIRMAHIYAVQRCNAKNKKFMSAELLQTVTRFKNTINIIRGDVSHIQLDGDDPISRRPPWLIVEANHNKPINIDQVTSLLSVHGFVEVKPHSFKGHRAIIAVDNFGSARRILRQFQSHSDFKIQQYNALKHSPLARTILWSSFVVSGVFLAWYGFKKLR